MARRRRQRVQTARRAGCAPPTSSFDTSVTAWSDYLQARLHPRSLASLRPHEHEYTDFELWGEGVALARAEGADESRGPMLLERVRRFLEECDAPQGFVLAADVNGGFGGLARELLAQIRDDYSTAPCVALAAGTHAGALPTSTAPSSPGKSGGDAPLEAAHRYRHALHDALALTSFDAELRCTTIPIYGSGALLSAAAHAAAGAAAAAAAQTSAAAAAAASGGGGLPYVVAPPYVTPRAELSYHAAAPLAALLDGITLPARARRAPASLGELVGALRVREGMHLAAGSLALPPPPPPHAAGGGIDGSGAWFTPCCPLQLPPASAPAYAQRVAWLGAPPAAAFDPRMPRGPAAAAAAGRAAAAAAARPRGSWRSCRCGATRRAARCGRGRSRCSCRSPSRSSSRRRSSLAADGHAARPLARRPTASCRCSDTPRAADDERAMSVPVGAALQCTPGRPCRWGGRRVVYRRCRDAYLAQPAPRGVERAQVLG